MIIDAEFEYGGHTYRVEQMSARTQLHVWRKFTPIYAAIEAGTVGIPVASEKHRGFLRGLAKIQALAVVPMADMDFILDEGVKALKRIGSDGVARSIGSSAANLQYDDIDGADLYEITERAVLENMLPFYGTDGSKSPEEDSMASDSIQSDSPTERAT